MNPGDHERFLSLYLEHQQGLRAFLVAVLRDWHRADDVLQEATLVCWRKFADYDQSRPFAAWARGVVWREMLKERRRMRSDPVLLTNDAVESLLVAFERTDGGADDRHVALRRCLQELDSDSRRLLVLRYTTELPLQTVAEQLGRSLTGVTKALSRLRELLRECIVRHAGGAR